ncbi:hypothetical protein HRG_004093 [Hirsutella rhossiliensis]|uniref:Fungal N-terminal domain-containing protein n=1 Tax=Hirsutella rhossiliensis TaxID=111463 RepID=A0A9P8N372_9HYPO|nr:uncharacterized protein HRG_04093 [Hirsutella rhossiliensis]KAH0966077.1 hypothetical protein HRG_04093 [Hirsutella rhossiliensis]
MGEILSITTAIIGLLAVGGRTMERIWDLNLPATKHSPALCHALQEVKQCRSTVTLLYKTLSLLEAGRLPLAERAAWIAVDDLAATLTDTVLAFSDLQAVCDELDQSRHLASIAAAPGPETTSAYAQRIGALCSRIRWQSLSMNLMITILKCPGEADAENARVGLHQRLTRILTSNTALSHRMRLLQGSPSSGTIIDRNSPPHYSPSDPGMPPSSPPRPTPSDSDSAPPGLADRRRAASPFSDYTLADIPVMSIVSLPVTTDELRDGSDVYTAAYARRMGRHLGELAWRAEAQNASRTLEGIRGRADADHNRDSTAGTVGSHEGGVPAHAAAAKKSRFYSIRVRRRCRA